MKETPRVQVEVIQPARTPKVPVSPNAKVNLALGFILGAGLGVGIALLRSLLDT